MSQQFEFEKNGQPINSLVLTAADFDANGVWSSDAVQVGNFSACEAFVDYEAVSPDAQPSTGNIAVDFEIRARLETEISGGNWRSLAAQVDRFDSVENDPTSRVLRADPNAFNPNPDSEVFDGIDQATVTATKHVGQQVRLCIVKKDVDRDGAAPFVSVTISADGQFY